MVADVAEEVVEDVVDDVVVGDVDVVVAAAAEEAVVIVVDVIADLKYALEGLNMWTLILRLDYEE